jgi:aspartate dehydrogenase
VRRGPLRVGLIGFGTIGRELYQHLAARPDDYAIAFVHARSATSVAGIPASLRLAQLADAQAYRPDLIVEAAAPAVTRLHGARLLAIADYLPLSVTALADDALLSNLVEVARAAGSHLLIPHGALVGAESLLEWREQWTAVTVTFRKHPDSIDFGGPTPRLEAPTVLFDGTVREIASRFPRNVNAMVTCALFSVGLGKCRARLIADPALRGAELEIEAVGRDGSQLKLHRTQPIVGVSGTEMAAALLRSVARAGSVRETLELV